MTHLQLSDVILLIFRGAGGKNTGFPLRVGFYLHMTSGPHSIYQVFLVLRIELLCSVLPIICMFIIFIIAILILLMIYDFQASQDNFLYIQRRHLKLAEIKYSQQQYIQNGICKQFDFMQLLSQPCWPTERYHVNENVCQCSELYLSTREITFLKVFFCSIEPFLCRLNVWGCVPFTLGNRTC